METRTMLRGFAVLFGLLAISNFMKPLEMSADHGFVLFGSRLSGTPNAIAGLVAGLFLSVYAFGMWQQRRFAQPMSLVYAGYVILNLVLFMINPPPGEGGGPLFAAVYTIIAVGVSSGAAYVLAARRDELL